MVRSVGEPVADDLLRVGELVAHSIASGSPKAYFQAGDDKLTSPAKRHFFVAIEDDLQALDARAWAALKAEALPRLTAPAPGRGWEELYSILNQARGYKRLAEMGCGCSCCGSRAEAPRLSGSESRTPLSDGGSVSVTNTRYLLATT